jgi:hypothetical protein
MVLAIILHILALCVQLISLHKICTQQPIIGQATSAQGFVDSVVIDKEGFIEIVETEEEIILSQIK